MHPSGVAKSSTASAGRWPGKGGNVTSAGWQVTLCDPMWHVSPRSGVATLRTDTLVTYLLAFTYSSGFQTGVRGPKGVRDGFPWGPREDSAK